MRRLRLLLDDEVDGGVVAAEGVGGHAGEERRVLSLGALDADGGQHAFLCPLLADGVPGNINSVIALPYYMYFT